jgi:peptidoglycan/LPS O-acetylase OafA/YrhL
MAESGEGEVKKAHATPRAQFSTVHAMRGFAALWVVLFHSRNFGAFQGSGLGRGDLLSQFLFDDGRGGVAIFFVLSGFVIAHSLWQTRMTGRSVAHFMLRRSIRLDPPYWASIALALVIFWARATRHGQAMTVAPGVVLAHLLYLQELLRLPEIQVVYWTLTYEIQFYFVYALLLWWLSFAEQRKVKPAILAAPAAALLACAFIAAAQHNEWVLHGLFLNYWDAFTAGVLAYLGGFRRSNTALVLCLLLSLIMLASAPLTAEVFNTPAALTAILLGFLARFGKLSNFAGGPLKGLGTISYSLYLVHVPAIFIFVSLAGVLFGPALGGIPSYVTVIAGCLAAATAFWWAIERPSHAFAKRIRTGNRERAATAPPPLRPETSTAGDQ